MEAATATRSSSAGLDADEVKKQAADIAGPDDDGSGIPGGALPQDDRFDSAEPPPAAEEPPTPPASLPDDGDGEEVEAPQLFVTGERQIGVKVGGRKPDTSVLKLKGTKIDLGGQFDRGDRLITVATLQISADLDSDTIDRVSGEVKSTSKVQTATLCGFMRLEEYIADRIEDSELRNRVLEALDAGE